MTEDRPPQQPAEEPRVPPGASPGDPPPITAFAWRNGLVRPTHGRLLAGVCGALGRATNTDPILWRVVLAVLTLFGGIGVLAYLLGWLLLPADGDSASPLEALLGRGRSGTSTVLTILGTIVALLAIGAFVSEPFRPGLLGAALLGGAVLLLLRDQRGRTRTAGPASMTAQPTWPTPGGVGVTTTTPETPGGAPTPAPPAAGAPVQPPFAPYGPFAPSGLPPQPPPPPVYGPPVMKPPPAPRPPRSRLGGLTFSVVLLVLGTLASAELLGYDVPAAGYFAAALATVGLGLLVGSWMGRARGLIALGIILAVALASVAAVDPFRSRWRGGTTTWAPTSVDQLEDVYRQEVGDLRIDLSAVDFRSTTSPVNIDVKVDVGSLTIILPPTVDAVIDANVEVGNADVLGENWSGLGLDARTVADNGTDGPGGGQVRIDAVVDLGNMEVHR